MDKSLNTLTPLCDFVARINNEGHEPTLVAFETVDTKGNWRVISDRFARRVCFFWSWCGWVDGWMLEIFLVEIPTKHGDFF